MKIYNKIIYCVIGILVILLLVKLFSRKNEKCSFYENFIVKSSNYPTNITYLITNENKGEYISLDNTSMKYNIIYFNKNKTNKPWKIYNYDNNSNKYGNIKGEVPYIFMKTISDNYYNPNITTLSKRVSLDSDKIYIFRINNRNNIIVPINIIGNKNWNNVVMLNNGENKLWNKLISYDNGSPVPLLENIGVGLNPDNYRTKKGDVYIISEDNINQYASFKNKQNILNILTNINKKTINNNILASLKKNSININLDKFNSNLNANVNLSNEQKANLLGKNVQLNKIILDELIKQDSSLSGKTQEQQYELLSLFFDYDKQLAKTLNDMSPNIPIKL